VFVFIRQSTTEKPIKMTGKEGKMMTLADLAKNKGDDDDRESYYAGGQKSGIQIQDPTQKKKEANDIISQVFEAAKKHGAKAAEETDSKSKEKFTGVGYRLGNTLEPSRPDPQTLVSKSKKDPIVKTIKFWKNGFQVGDDGPLRSYTDPANAAFLEDIHKGVIPRELEVEIGPERELHVNLIDHKHEEWKEPPKPKIIPFSGTGHTLGGATTISSMSGSVTPSGISPPSSSSTIPMTPPSNVSVDESQPTTSLQIRLYDGTRLVAKFNHTNTIADIRNFVEHAKRLPPGKSYDLMTSYPPKVLTDMNQTIRDAGLINAVLVQKLK
jgi:UBX domain-containing protein 1